MGWPRWILAGLGKGDGAHSARRRERLQVVLRCSTTAGRHFSTALGGLSEMKASNCSAPRRPRPNANARLDRRAPACRRGLSAPGRTGIFASHGDFYAMTVAGRLGVARDGLVRIGWACYKPTRRSPGSSRVAGDREGS